MAENLRPVGEPIPAHPNTINSVAFNPGGDRIVSGGVDNNSTGMGCLLAQINWDSAGRSPRSRVGGGVSTKTGTRIVSGSVDGFSGVSGMWVAGLPIPAGAGRGHSCSRVHSQGQPGWPPGAPMAQ